MSETRVATTTRGTVATLRPEALSQEQMDLIKRTVAKGATNDELALFFHVCNRSGLDPFLRQIHSVPRREQVDGQWRDTRAIQVGIDGLRLVAERSGRYAPGEQPPQFEYGPDGALLKAVAYVKKQTSDGTWHTVAAEAYFDEYAQRKSDGTLTRMWKEKPHVMLGKVGEALALRRAFPMETSGLYIHEELPEAGRVRERRDIATPRATATETPAPDTDAGGPEGPYIIEKYRRMMFGRAAEADHRDDTVRAWLQKKYGIASSKRVPARLFDEVLKRLSNKTRLLDNEGNPVDLGDTVGREPGADDDTAEPAE